MTRPMSVPGAMHSLQRISFRIRPARLPVSPRLPLSWTLAKRNITTASSISDERVNAPLTTLPPPFEDTSRNPDHNLFQHLFKLGRTYLTFYKDGVKRVLGNRRLLRSKIKSLPNDDRPSIFRPSHVPKSFTRADWVLFWRASHDNARLPLFAIIFLIFEETTPLIAYLVDGIMPYTCRLPGQIQRARQKAKERRTHSLQELGWRFPGGPSTVTGPVARDHTLRSLHLISTFWDKLNVVPPGLWMVKGRTRIAILEADDRLLRQSSGARNLSDEELIIACTERGIDTSATGHIAEARERLGRWLELTDATNAVERRKRMAILLMTKTQDWPKSRNFPLPDWDLL